MRKYTLNFTIFAAFVAVAVSAFGLSALISQEAKTAPAAPKETREISLKLGDKKVDIPYEELGISVQNGSAETDRDFGMASIFSADNQKSAQSIRDISIDTKLLAHAIISIFPYLNLPEDAHSSFFITSPEQKIKPTFNLRKLVAQLKENAFDSRGSAIEIEMIPEDIEAKKKQLAGKEILVKLEGGDAQTLNWKIPAEVALDEAKLRDFIENKIAKKVDREPQDAFIKEFIDEGKAAHAEAEGFAKDGISVEVEKNLELIRSAVLKGVFEVNLKVEFVQSYVFNETDADFGNLDLLAVGRSNFAGSPEGRAFNIQKGLNEKMNNIMIPPGAEFAFNSFLGPITSAQGWKKALGIFGGGNLAPTLGGGLCQVSTTVYRAALMAGLPIIERKPHSLYVSYYKQFGEGLDATIFSTGPDLVFINDTPSYIFIQSYAEGDDAYVKIFGTSDGRTAELEGPYRSHDIPQDKGYKPSRSEIVWFRTVARPDGSEKEEMITSRYKTLPKHP